MKERQSGTSHKLVTYILPVIVVMLLLLLVGTLYGTYQKNDKQPSTLAGIEKTSPPTSSKEEMQLAIVKKIDYDGKLITMRLLGEEVEFLLDYTSETQFISRYKEKIQPTQVVAGEIVEFAYDKTSNRLTRCDITDKAWEYKKVSKWTMDKSMKSIKVGSQSYSYNNNFLVFYNGQEIDTNTLSEKDELTIKGIDGQAYSMIVTKGHGYIKLSNYDAFLGGTIEVGYDTIQEIKSDMVIVVREGEYKVLLKNKGIESSKYVYVLPGEEATLDMSEYKVDLIRSGTIAFTIAPYGEKLTIDGTSYSYKDPVTLPFGNYEVQVESEGYKTYLGKLTVEEAHQTVTISLEEDVASTETPSVTIEDTDEEEVIATQTPSKTTSPTTEDTTEDTTGGTVSIDENHSISILTPVGAEVYVNSQYKGTIPLTFPKVLGTDLKLKLTMDGEESKTYTLDVIDDNQNLTWNFSKWW